jgi:2-oxoglutarate/2-oxoacid ferredoxin oxidoreductase subunit beta
MASIPKPLIPLQQLERNDLGLTVRDYEGAPSTLCAGCGHDSVTAAIVRALHELDLPPHRVAKLSGIGCSSKTTAYFARGAHGLNSAHGRMAAIATGANAADRSLHYIGISGDGDSLSIGLGHLVHAMRRNTRMVYVIENNGVYGLTKGQFSASADIGSTSKRGEPNRVQPIDPMLLGLSLGATFLGRAFSGDKERLVPMLKAAFSHRGFALLDVISPCVTFNAHEGSTKSYQYVRSHEVQLPEELVQEEIVAAVPDDGAISVRMHDGSVIRFRGVPEDYDPTDRFSVAHYLEEQQAKGEVVTGVLYVDEDVPDVHELNSTSDQPLRSLPFEKLCPGSADLVRLQQQFR